MLEKGGRVGAPAGVVPARLRPGLHVDIPEDRDDVIMIAFCLCFISHHFLLSASGSLAASLKSSANDSGRGPPTSTWYLVVGHLSRYQPGQLVHLAAHLDLHHPLRPELELGVQLPDDLSSSQAGVQT